MILKDIGLIFILLILCIIILSLIAPIIDNIFFIGDDLDKLSKIYILTIIIIHIFTIGIFILLIHYFIISDYLMYFKLLKHERYTKLLIDLIITLTLTGLQKNLFTKLKYISTNHPIRL